MGRSVVAYFLGGTISMAGSDPGEGAGAVVRLDGSQLLAGVPQLAELDVTVAAHQFRALPSAALTFDDVVELVAVARAAVSGGADGVVVVQGTDTIEESAYLIDLLWDLPAPVVVTGAMRNPSLAGPDGPANLMAAVAVAADPTCAGLGALVVFADEIHAARHVRKANTTSVGTFVSANTGPLGHVVERVPRLLARVARRPTYRVTGDVSARVPVLAVGLDEDAELLDGLAARCDGLVVAGLGAGHVPPALAEPLGVLAGRCPVVLASRTGSGSVLTHTYGAVGAETDLLARGLVGAGFLDPYKARVLLRVLLAAGADRRAIIAAYESAD